MDRPFDRIVLYQRDAVLFCPNNPDWVAHVQSGAYREWVNKQYS
jgi:dTDP-glucose 4,6-dehydratase